MSKSRDRHEDSEDDARPITTLPDNRSSWSGRPTHRIKLAIYAIFGIPVFLYSWLIFFSERVSTSYVSPELLRASSIMWLTAHRELSKLCLVPKSVLLLTLIKLADDESMFFAPSIFNMLSEHDAPNGTHIKPEGHILSLSSGNSDGLGAVRTVEMRHACLAYGITAENCIVLDQK
jgi:hypothetical protein